MCEAESRKLRNVLVKKRIPAGRYQNISPYINADTIISCHLDHIGLYVMNPSVGYRLVSQPHV